MDNRAQLGSAGALSQFGMYIVLKSVPPSSPMGLRLCIDIRLGDGDDMVFKNEHCVCAVLIEQIHVHSGPYIGHCGYACGNDKRRLVSLRSRNLPPKVSPDGCDAPL